MKTLSPEQMARIALPLPAEAVFPHPTKTYLSSIKAIYVTERLNEVFGVGRWSIAAEIAERATNGMVVVKVTFRVPEYDIYYECFGGNDNGGENSKNFDLGDAYKGATTDAITKIGSWLGIGIDVFKGKVKPASRARTTPAPATKPVAPAPAPELFNNALVDKIVQCADMDTLQAIWVANPTLQGNPDFKKLITTRKKELLNER